MIAKKFSEVLVIVIGKEIFPRRRLVADMPKSFTSEE
jgi:hypothetical protein